MADIIETLIADEKKGTGNFDQAFSDAYKYVYGGGGDWQKRLSDLKMAIDKNNADSTNFQIKEPFTIDQAGNIEFSPNSTSYTNPKDSNQQSFTFPDGSKYSTTGSDTNKMLTRTDVYGHTKNYKWDNNSGVSAYREWDDSRSEFKPNGDTVTKDDTTGDLTFTSQGLSVKYAVNGDVITTISNANGTRIQIQHPGGSDGVHGAIEEIDTDMNTKRQTKTTKYPNGFSLTEAFDANGHPIVTDPTRGLPTLSFTGIVNGQQTTVNLYNTKDGAWVDGLGNSVNPPVFDAASGTTTINFADKRKYELDEKSMTFKSFSAAGILSSEIAMGLPQGSQGNLTIPTPDATPAATAVATASPEATVAATQAATADAAGTATP